MIKLKDNTLSFKFPDIPRQLESLLEQHIQKILPTLALPSNRTKLVKMLKQFIRFGSTWDLRRATPQEKTEDAKRDAAFPERRKSKWERVNATAESLTPADLEAALRETANDNAGIDESMAELDISFQRTLRIPDDGKTYPLPAGAGQFPICTIDDFAVPEEWSKRGGVMMPMYQSEALWLGFRADYPFAVKVGAGKINAISGEPWSSDFQQSPQNYVVVPKQPWLDGFSVGEGLIRQFVAMPLGSGFSAEEQLTGKSEFGGIQLQVCPMRVEDYFQKIVLPSLPEELLELAPALFKKHLACRPSGVFRSPPRPLDSMGLAAGGTMRQEIYQDQNEFSDWDQTRSRRCFVHLCNSLVWRQITASNPPNPPMTAQEYSKAGIPWFDYYQDNLPALKGSKQLAGVKSVMTLGMENNTQPLPENTSITPTKIVQYGNARRPRKIREFLDDR